jgi:hypothetical protein
MEEKTKSMCIGCTENFYNGNNPYGITECWGFATATVEKRKFVPMDMRPPWDLPSEETLDCHKKKGYISVREGVMC